MSDLAVIGLGYIGLPLAHAAASVGLNVTGFDVSARVVEGLMAGRSHIDDMADAQVAEMVAAGFTATSDPSALADADAIVVCVPTPLSGSGGPDLAAVTRAMTTIAGQLRAGQLVVLESTTYPGTTEEVAAPILERSGLTAGVDFDLAFSPERVDPGNPTYGLTNTPKVVAGVNAQSTERAAAFYSQFAQEVVVGSGTREAEAAKLLENTYRNVNIALANEFARVCHELDIDVWEVIRLASTKPFGFQAFYPGPGVGGHCIPIDPFYLTHHVRERTGKAFRIVELAGEINDGAPQYVADRVAQLLRDAGANPRGAGVLLLGVTYKPNIADQRESPAIPLAGALMGAGMVVSFHDPHVREWRLPSGPMERVESLDDAVAEADIVVLVQHHRDYDVADLARRAKVLFSTRGHTGVDGVVPL